MSSYAFSIRCEDLVAQFMWQAPIFGNKLVDIVTLPVRRRRLVQVEGCPLLAVIMQRAGCRRPGDTRDRAQILVDGAQVMLRHILKVGPRHNLEKISINCITG